MRTARRKRLLEKQEIADARRLVGEVLYILNYKDNQPTLMDLEMDEIGKEVDESKTSPMSNVLDVEYEYDPSARLPIATKEEMLECQNALRQLMESWITSTFDIAVWSCREKLEKALNRRRIVFYRADASGRPMYFLEMPGSGGDDGYTRAVEYMFRFITSTLYQSVGRCVRCGTYYSLRQANQKFCSTTCNKGFFARQATLKARDRERRSKLERLEKAKQNYPNLPSTHTARKSEKGQLKWLAGQAKVKPHFITRAVKNKEFSLKGIGP